MTAKRRKRPTSPTAAGSGTATGGSRSETAPSGGSTLEGLFEGQDDADPTGDGPIRGRAGGREQPREDGGALVPRVQPTEVPAQRGTLDIAPRVVERIAQGAAARVPGVRPVSRRVGADRVQADARVLGDAASVHLQVAVGYPSPVRETCRQVRTAVVGEVRRLTGIEVTRLDVQVAELQHRPGGTRRVR